MKLNLQPHLDVDRDLVGAALLRAGFEHEDNMFYVLYGEELAQDDGSRPDASDPNPVATTPYDDRYTPPKRRKELTSLLLFPRLLTYREAGEEYTTPWIACRFWAHDEAEAEAAMEALLAVFPFLSLKPFHDEDATRGFFAAMPGLGSSGVRYAFYLNPDYPQGYWYNHTL